ncbi:MAG: hypothetical protein IJF88_09995 [Oscillospiraceae bacterium]|nr:hypothetical protein [Oscillospiraceae bacterium]
MKNRKVFTTFVCIILVLASISSSALAVDDTVKKIMPGVREIKKDGVISKETKEMSLEELQKLLQSIDFSKEPSEEEKALLETYYILDSNLVFNDEYAKEIYQRDCNEINSLSEEQKEQLYYKESVEYCSQAAETQGSSSLGTYGDILVSFTSSSFGYNWGLPGHAAIVHTNSRYTIESFPNGGVRIYTNNWGSKTKVYGVRVKGASSNSYTRAAQYAISQANQGKKYNWIFINKGTTGSFYCSQLVWRAWKNQGFEVDRMNLGNWEPVSPAELVGGSRTYVFYYRG